MPDRTIMVGEHTYECNEHEWVAATADVGAAVEFRKKEWATPRRGAYRSSHFYDGVIAKVTEADPDDLIEHTLFLDLGDELRFA